MSDRNVKTWVSTFREKLKDLSTQKIWTWNLHESEPEPEPEPEVTQEPPDWTNALLWCDLINNGLWLTDGTEAAMGTINTENALMEFVTNLWTREGLTLCRENTWRRREERHLDDIIKSSKDTPAEQTDLYHKQVGESQTDR